MIWKIALYTIVVSAALSLAGAGLDRVVARRWPKRLVWAACMAGSILFPVWAMWQAEPLPLSAPPPRLTGVVAMQALPALPPGFATESLQVPNSATPPSGQAGAGRDLFIVSDRMLIALWVLASMAVLLYQAGAAWLLSRQAARWRRAVVLDEPVLVSERAGPALLGVFRPRIVVPRWFLAEPVESRSLILAHERQHLQARDPLLLWSGVLAAALVPWNLPLWWQLRRLRFAIELDCDARCLQSGADPDTYGEVLLIVTRRAVSVPMGAVAMSEPASALEQRIRHLLPHQHGFAALRITGGVALAALGFYITLTLRAPALRTAVVTPAQERQPFPVSAPTVAVLPQPADAAPDPAVQITAEGTTISNVAERVDAEPTTELQGLPKQRSVTLQSPLLPVNYDAWRSSLLIQNVALQRYPTLLLPSDGPEMNQVTLFLRADGTVEKEYVEHLSRGQLVRSGNDPGRAAAMAQLIAQRLKIDPDRIGAVGVTDAYRQVPLPQASGDGPTPMTQTRADLLHVVFAWPRRTGESAPSLMLANGAMLARGSADPLASLMPPKDPLDAAAALVLVESHLPDAFKTDEAAAGSPVILLNARGEFVRAGRERIPGSGTGPRLIRDSQLLGMQTNQVSWKTVTNQVGDRADVLFAWQAP